MYIRCKYNNDRSYTQIYLTIFELWVLKGLLANKSFLNNVTKYMYKSDKKRRYNVYMNIIQQKITRKLNPSPRNRQ